MSLRAELADAAHSAAKAAGHERVEPRHVLYAIAKRFRVRPEVEAMLTAARAALEPPGRAGKVAAEAPEATAILDTISTEEDAVTALLNGMKEAPASGGSAAQRQSAQADAVKADAGPEVAPRKQEITADVLAELDALVGLGRVKAQVRNVVAVVQANTERVKAGLQPVNPSLHLVFTGPPGTGKTTVARLIARLYAAAGALPGAGFTEATRADLIAGYVGQTAIKTTEVIQRTRPGVLFIDEAYALAPSSSVDFGGEAIATLVKAMEDHRDTLAVIVAGYADEMTTFIDSNPGLRSRFKTYIDFPNYSPGELLQIFERFVSEAQIALADGVLDKAGQVLEAAVEREAFGNARFVRSLFEQAYTNMAAHAAADGTVSVSELRVIRPEDVVLDDDALRRRAKRIGF
jgi:SpoVK/Ycf46/Vps4 family AAA+-type ATPase